MKTILINGRHRNYPGTDISYAEVCRLAFIVTLPRLQVTYTKPDEGVEVEMTPTSGRIDVVDRMRFEVEQQELK